MARNSEVTRVACVGFGLIPGISGYKEMYGLGKQLWQFSIGWKKLVGYYFRLDSLKFTGVFCLLNHPHI